MSLDAAAVRRIARLARVGIEDADLEQLQAELTGILGWIEQLLEIDVEGIAPMVGTEQTTLRLRADVVTETGLTEAVLSNAPDREGSFYAVPKVVE